LILLSEECGAFVTSGIEQQLILPTAHRLVFFCGRNIPIYIVFTPSKLVPVIIGIPFHFVPYSYGSNNNSTDQAATGIFQNSNVSVTFKAVAMSPRLLTTNSHSITPYSTPSSSRS
jgi:hypothetical protein